MANAIIEQFLGQGGFNPSKPVLQEIETQLIKPPDPRELSRLIRQSGCDRPTARLIADNLLASVVGFRGVSGTDPLRFYGDDCTPLPSHH